MTSEVDITARATDEITPAFQKGLAAVTALDTALLKLAQNESAKKTADEAKAAFEKMSEAEKAALIEANKVSSKGITSSGTSGSLGAIAKSIDGVTRAGGEGSKMVGGLSDALTGLGVSLPTIGVAALTGAIAQAGRALYSFEQEAVTAQISDAKLGAVISATGGAAGLNVQQINEMTDSLARLNGVDDEAVKQSETVLLTFRNIGGDVFPRATQAIIDMSAVMGQSLQSSATQLGKALNDPAEGMSALQRVGVTFNETQKTQIENFMKAGDAASAQAVILKELETEFGGAGQAMADAGDYSAQLDLAVGNLKESIGTGLIPVVRSVKEYLASSAEGWTSYINGARQAGDVSARVNEILQEQAGAMGGEAFDRWKATHQDAVDAAKKRVAAEMEAANAIKTNTGETKNNTEELEKAAKAAEEMAKARDEANKAMLSTISSVASADKSNTQAMMGLEQQRAEKLAEINKLKSQGYSEKGATLGGAINELSQSDAKITETAANYRDQMNQMIAADVLKKLSTEGLTDAETAYYIKVQQDLGLITAEQAKQAQEIEKQASAIAAAAPGGTGGGGIAAPAQASAYAGAGGGAAPAPAVAEAQAGANMKEAGAAFTTGEAMRLANSEEAWKIYSDTLSGAVDSNILKLDQYLDRLGEIPDSIQTDVIMNVVAPPETHANTLANNITLQQGLGAQNLSRLPQGQNKSLSLTATNIYITATRVYSEGVR